MVYTCICMREFKHVCTLFRRVCTCLYKYIRVLTHINIQRYLKITKKISENGKKYIFKYIKISFQISKKIYFSLKRYNKIPFYISKNMLRYLF